MVFGVYGVFGYSILYVHEACFVALSHSCTKRNKSESVYATMHTRCVWHFDNPIMIVNTILLGLAGKVFSASFWLTHFVQLFLHPLLIFIAWLSVYGFTLLKLCVCVESKRLVDRIPFGNCVATGGFCVGMVGQWIWLSFWLFVFSNPMIWLWLNGIFRHNCYQHG